MAVLPIDLLTRRADEARPELRIRRAVVATSPPRWLLPLQVVAFLAVVAVAASFLAGRGPIAVALTAAAASAVSGALGVRFTPTTVLAFSEGRAHVFEGRRGWTGVQVGDYRGPLLGGELEFVGGGRVRDTWRLLHRRVRVLRVHRPLLDVYAG